MALGIETYDFVQILHCPVILIKVDLTLYPFSGSSGPVYFLEATPDERCGPCGGCVVNLNYFFLRRILMVMTAQMGTISRNM